MATIITTATTNFNQTVVALVQKTLEEELRAPLPHLVAGNYRKASFVKGTNNTMRFIRIADMSVTVGTPSAGTPPWLTEGTAPTSEDLDIGYEEFTANQAGRVIKISDVALLQNPFDLLAEAANRVTRNALATADRRVADIILAGTNVIYSGTGNAATADVAAGDVLTGANVKRAVANLKADSVPTFPDGTYHAIIHPGVVLDLESDDDVGGWIDAQRYAGASALMTGELGKYAGVRFIESANAGIQTGDGTSSIDVYSTTIFGPEAYAFGDWGTIEVTFEAPGGHDDPLKQSALVGWKGYFGAMLLDEAGARYIRIESASSL